MSLMINCGRSRRVHLMGQREGHWSSSAQKLSRWEQTLDTRAIPQVIYLYLHNHSSQFYNKCWRGLIFCGFVQIVKIVQNSNILYMFHISHQLRARSWKQALKRGNNSTSSGIALVEWELGLISWKLKLSNSCFEEKAKIIFIFTFSNF